MSEPSKNPHLTLAERASFQFPPGFTIYRVQDCWKVRRGVVIRGARRWWMRSWQSEWDGAPRAFRAFTRNGALIRGVRAARTSSDHKRYCSLPAAHQGQCAPDPSVQP